MALREFLEHLRTKTFWIGILSFPVILVLSVLVPNWLSKKVDVRRYAVLDLSESGWLSQEVRARAETPDIYKVLLALKAAHARGGAGLELLPETLRGEQALMQLASLPEDKIRQAAENIHKLRTPEGMAFLESLPVELRRRFEESREELRRWYKNLPPEQAKEYAPRENGSRYKLLELSELGAADEERLRSLVDQGRLFAYFVIGPDPIEGNTECKYVSRNLTDTSLRQWYQRIATEAVRERRVARVNLSPDQAAWLSAPLAFQEKALSAGGEEKEARARDKVLQYAPVAFVYILWIGIFVVAQILLTSTIEEKSNRVMEVLLSSVTPLQLMAGKILGPAATGLAIVGSWAVFFFLGVTFMPLLVPGMRELHLEEILENPAYMASFLLYFLLGYLLYAALLVGVGSVCNSLKEAQNLMQPLIIVLLVPLLAMIPVVQDPNGALARALSLVPLFTPFLMMNRVAGPPELWEYALTTLLLLATIAFAFWGSAKIFRVGILMTGKPPRLREILGWLKAPVGRVPVRRE